MLHSKYVYLNCVFALKGIGHFRVGDDRQAMTAEVDTTTPTDDSSEELPTFRTNHES